MTVPNLHHHNHQKVVLTTSKVIWFACLLVIGTQVTLFTLFNNKSSYGKAGMPLSLVDISIATPEGATTSVSRQQQYPQRLGASHWQPQQTRGGAEQHTYFYDSPNAALNKAKSEIRDFERQDGVVIAVKVHGDENSIYELQQSLCLLKAAYNGRMQYDHVVFTTLELPDEVVAMLKLLVSPAKLQVVMDSKPVLEEIASLSPPQRQRFMQRCNFTQAQIDAGRVNWKSKCREGLPHVKDAELSYNWMAEFRTKHLWTHPALAPYSYMMWFDADAMCTGVWDKDPVATLIRNQLVLLFDNFPSERVYDDGYTLQTRIKRAFDGREVCSIRLTRTGHLVPISPPHCPPNAAIDTVHGFFHVTDLNFFRSAPALKWANTLVGEDKYSRQFNDEVGVTVAAAMLAPKRAWDMQTNGINLHVLHNGKFDGSDRFARKSAIINGKKHPWYSYMHWWTALGRQEFPTAWDVCYPLVNVPG